MKRSRFSEEQIIGILKEQEAGAPTAEVCRRHGISSATFYIYGRLSRCKDFLELNRPHFPGCEHLSGVTGHRCAQMGIPRGEPQQMVGLSGPL
jgi:hypothetical protein